MTVASSIHAVRAQVKAWREQSARIGFVATMGNLHAGHMDLFRTIAPHCDRVVCSIFANPLQFGPAEDYAAYPRTLDADIDKLQSIGADLLFAPTVQEMYGSSGMSDTKVSVKRLNNLYCGKLREGHFIGVATVVCKLFNIVSPHVAVFGEKDYQQLAVIRQMVSDLSIPVDILSSPTIREKSGLASSSRNQYLTPAEKTTAALIYSVLCEMRKAIEAGDGNFNDLEARATTRLVCAGFSPDYITVADAMTLLPAQPDTRNLVILVAARLGKARLIDNVTVTI
ncbi:MAG: pantoate--beta-alanine ligase [Gammaproteobacteria bacterium]|nr:pantoate--beta-alanine ligase [Gammaproteobacteria bacterium]